jgi:hypothetical protein
MICKHVYLYNSRRSLLQPVWAFWEPFKLRNTAQACVFEKTQLRGPRKHCTGVRFRENSTSGLSETLHRRAFSTKLDFETLENIARACVFEQTRLRGL